MIWTIFDMKISWLNSRITAGFLMPFFYLCHAWWWKLVLTSFCSLFVWTKAKKCIPFTGPPLLFLTVCWPFLARKTRLKSAHFSSFIHKTAPNSPKMTKKDIKMSQTLWRLIAPFQRQIRPFQRQIAPLSVWKRLFRVKKHPLAH